MNNKKYILNSLSYKYFGNNLLKSKKLSDTLISLEELLNIKKNIKKMFNTDNPQEIKNLLGLEINNITVSIKDIKYVKLIDKKYKKIYIKCKKLLEKRNEI